MWNWDFGLKSNLNRVKFREEREGERERENTTKKQTLRVARYSTTLLPPLLYIFHLYTINDLFFNPCFFALKQQTVINRDLFFMRANKTPPSHRTVETRLTPLLPLRHLNKMSTVIISLFNRQRKHTTDRPASPSLQVRIKISPVPTQIFSIHNPREGRRRKRKRRRRNGLWNAGCRVFGGRWPPLAG